MAHFKPPIPFDPFWFDSVIEWHSFLSWASADMCFLLYAVLDSVQSRRQQTLAQQHRQKDRAILHPMTNQIHHSNFPSSSRAQSWYNRRCCCCCPLLDEEAIPPPRLRCILGIVVHSWILPASSKTSPEILPRVGAEASWLSVSTIEEEETILAMLRFPTRASTRAMLP